jgi:sugar phosphate isomerase/epimerase
MSAHALLLHSVSYAGFWGQAFLPVDRFLHKAASLGFNGVMLMAKGPHVSLLDYHSEAQRSELRAQIESWGLQQVAIAGYCDITAGLERGEIPNREIQAHYIIELARLTRDLGGHLLRIFTGYEHPVGTYSQQWNMVVQTLRECSRRAADWGVIIGVQNHHDIACGWEAMYDLIQEVNQPNCRALFDAWAPALQGADLATAATRMAPVMAHTTVADYQLRPRFRYNNAVVNFESLTPAAQAVKMGEGFIPYAEFFSALRGAGFQGSIAYEMCSPLIGGGSEENLDAYAHHFIEYMQQWKAAATSAAQTT